MLCVDAPFRYGVHYSRCRRSSIPGSTAGNLVPLGVLVDNAILCLTRDLHLKASTAAVRCSGRGDIDDRCGLGL